MAKRKKKNGKKVEPPKSLEKKPRDIPQARIVTLPIQGNVLMAILTRLHGSALPEGFTTTLTHVEADHRLGELVVRCFIRANPPAVDPKSMPGYTVTEVPPSKPEAQSK